MYILIPITEDPAENSVENARVCLHNLRHIANYHGFDLEKLDPEIFPGPSQNPTATPVSAPKRNKIGPTPESQAFLDNFDMGNDVNRNDPDAVSLERDIAKLHKRIKAYANSKASKDAP
jgi:hypothetical protein